MNLTKFITDYHSFLLDTATNITIKDVNSQEMRYELLSFVTILIIEDGRYNNLDTVEDYKWLFVRYLTNQYRWKQGEFWKHLHPDRKVDYEIPIRNDNEYFDILSDCDNNCDEDLELLNFYGELSLDKIKFVREFEENLPQHQRNLYELYINQRLSLQKIAIRIGIPKPSVFLMVRDLKQLILESWEKH